MNSVRPRFGAQEFVEGFKALHQVIGPKGGRSLSLLTLLLIVTSIVETVGVGVVVPFVAIATNPRMIETSHLLRGLPKAFGFTEGRNFVVAIGAIAFVTILAGNGLRAASTWASHKVSQELGHRLSESLLGAYLSRPYAYFLGRNSASLGNTLLHEVHQVVNSVIFPILLMASRLVTAILIVAMLVVASPIVTAAAVLSLGGGFYLIYRTSKRLQVSLGKDYAHDNAQRYLVASEIFSGIKEIKVGNLEKRSLARYAEPSARYASGLALSMTLSQAPRFVVEAIAFGAVVAFITGMLMSGQSVIALMPMITLYVFAGYRLLPAAQEIYSSVTRIRFAWPSYVTVMSELVHRPNQEEAFPNQVVPEPLAFTDALVFENLSFTYEGAGAPILTDVTLRIPSGAKVGIVGPTGAGKSTLVDLMMGLLEPCAGDIKVDGVSLRGAGARKAWQAIVGYVPQHVFLADDTIAANIAFGAELENVDMDRVVGAARTAQLADFVEAELPDGYATRTGERGVKLSGGQRQRLGLARALYKQPRVLVLDEATSALDNETEGKVVKALEKMGQGVTVIAIAHRLSTLANCDFILEVARGGVTVRQTTDLTALNNDSLTSNSTSMAAI